MEGHITKKEYLDRIKMFNKAAKKRLLTGWDLYFAVIILLLLCLMGVLFASTDLGSGTKGGVKGKTSGALQYTAIFVPLAVLNIILVLHRYWVYPVTMDFAKKALEIECTNANLQDLPTKGIRWVVVAGTEEDVTVPDITALASLKPTEKPDDERDNRVTLEKITLLCQSTLSPTATGGYYIPANASA